MSIPHPITDQVLDCEARVPQIPSDAMIERPPAEVVLAIREADSRVPLLIDFDETLFLQNSTEEYFRSLRPRLLGIFFLKLLEIVRPWALLGSKRGHAVRDWVRVVCLTVLFPWTYWVWCRRCRQLAAQFENAELTHAIASNPDRSIVIASNGFGFIIRPLLQEMKTPCAELIACRFWGGVRDRCIGKTRLLQQRLGSKTVASALVVTDSRNDQNLLEAAEHPFLVNWSISGNEQGGEKGYLPFYYMERVKKPNSNFFFREILIENLFPMVLLFSWGNAHPLVHAIGLAFLWFSFLCIYEIGYMENDLIASKYERDPTLAEDHEKHRPRIDFYWPWLWALVFAVPGLLLWQLVERFDQPWQSWLGSGQQLLQLGLQIGLWGLFLLATRIVFCVYNHVDERSRTWLYPVLQMMKFVGLLMFTPASPLAWVYLVSLIYARWIPYIVYRYGNLNAFPNFPIPLMHLIGMTIVLVPLIVGGGIKLDPWQLGLLLPIVCYRASKNVIDLVRGVRPLGVAVPGKISLGWIVSKLFAKQ